MMATIDEILDRLERLLDDERLAIRRLDAAAVARAAEEKERLCAALRAHTPPRGVAIEARLQRVAGALRHNVVLLAHARDCLRDVLSAVHGVPVRPASAPLARPVVPAPGILTARG